MIKNRALSDLMRRCLEKGTNSSILRLIMVIGWLITTVCGFESRSQQCLEMPIGGFYIIR